MPQDNRPVLRIGACPFESVEKTQDQFQPFINYLERKTGYRVELIVAPDYRTIGEKMIQKQIDIARFGPFSYVVARKASGVTAFAGNTSSGKENRYYSLIITHPETGITKLDQLRGRHMTFIDPESTSGYLIPKAMLLQNGLNPDQDLGELSFAGHHDAAILAVKKRTVDAAAVSSVILQNMRNKGLVGDKDYRIIQTSDPIPSSGAVWAYRDGLQEDFRQKVITAFFDSNQEEGLWGVFSKDMTTFSPINDHDFEIIRQTSKQLGMDVY